VAFDREMGLSPCCAGTVWLRTGASTHGEVAVELIVPALAALLAIPVRHLLRDLRPLLRSLEPHQHP